MNANIPVHKAKTSYSNIDDDLDDIRIYDSPYLAKMDIADAFRLLPLKPARYNLTGFKLNGEYYYDCCVPMGASSSCLTFERVSDSLLHIIQNKYKVKHVLKVIDDFLFIAETKEECQRALDSFEGPTKCLTFLGIQIDTEKGELSIPPEKFAKYTNDINVALKADSIT